MVRISDARMSGTAAYGTVVLHVAPEAAAGGPLALIRTGDPVVFDVPARSLDMDVPVEERERRRRAWVSCLPANESGWLGLYRGHVLQSDQGCDLDFLVGRRGNAVPRHNH